MENRSVRCEERKGLESFRSDTTETLVSSGLRTAAGESAWQAVLSEAEFHALVEFFQLLDRWDREEELSDPLGGILKDIYVPDSVVRDIEKSLASDKASRADRLRAEQARLQHDLTARTRMDHTYLDKLDGKIPAEFWERKNAEWLQEDQQVQFGLAGLKQADEPARLLTASRTLELTNKAYSLHVRQNLTEEAKLLKMVLSNCKIDAVSLTPTCRKPFDREPKMRNGAP